MDPAEIRILLEEKLSPQLEGENTIIFLTKQIESRLESIIEDLIDLPPGKMDENILDYLSISRNFGLHGITNTLTELIAEKVGIPVIEKVLSPKKKIKQTELEFEYLLTQGKNLSWIQPGLTYGAHEVNCASGRLDILATNSQGKKVMIELKYADYEDYQVYHQLKKYMGNFSQRQMIFAAPVIKSGLWFALQEDGYFIDNRLTCFEFKKIEDHYEFREITRSDFPEEVKPSFITSPTPKKKSSSPIRTFVTLPKKPTSASPNILTTKVKAITQTMHELFTNYRHHPDYSFWGIAYFWSGEQT